MVKAVALQQIDVVEPESLERGVDGREDVLKSEKTGFSTDTDTSVDERERKGEER